MDAVQLDFFADDPNNSPMLLSALGEGVQAEWLYTLPIDFQFLYRTFRALWAGESFKGRLK